jgi:acetyl esterase
MNNDRTLDPWVTDWLEAHPLEATPFEDFAPEILDLARGAMGSSPSRHIARVTDDFVGDAPIRIYAADGPATGLIVYFHGGGWMIGSIGLMDNVARELAHSTGAVVVSVGYRLAPEHPYPAGLDDCEAVTRWALTNATKFDVPPESVALAGESAGGNLAAAVALRLRDAGDAAVAGQVLIYPVLDNATASYDSREAFAGLIVSRKQMIRYWEAYSGGRELDEDPFAAPLHADTLAGLPPALIVLGGCDLLRDEGSEYAARLRDDGVEVEAVCYPGQPHGFVNFGFPAAAVAFERIGLWLRSAFARSGGSTPDLG